MLNAGNEDKSWPKNQELTDAITKKNKKKIKKILISIDF
jgi:hypothetical protein